MIILRINIDCKLFLWKNRDSFAFLSENFLLVSKQKKRSVDRFFISYLYRRKPAIAALPHSYGFGRGYRHHATHGPHKD
ncbi:hypothetical protein B4X80_17935 [Listeria monocytogenes]|nr:hypothetical protein [Listeria monocytogenes]EAC5443450.1 hypothetical protein [Listeria monocytogenes]EAC5460177.1 hypothetical protein [Listeria monocytogenes]EAC9345285.1 hypothetical protein [Listeria monocytogenes]EAC9468365.1 hypothetical protein [Listeria monocytogenes]